MSNNGVLQAKNTKYLPANTTTYNVTQDDDFIYVDTSLNAVTIVLPNIRNGALTENPKCFKINDYTGNAGTNNITVEGCGGDSVNSTASFVMSNNYESLETNVVNLDEWFASSSAGNTPVTGFVPYTGATQNVNLGTFSISLGSMSVTGTAGSGYVAYATQSVQPSTPVSGFRLYSGSSSTVNWLSPNGFITRLDSTANLADRTYTFPDASGTIALTSSLTGYVPYTGATTNVDLGVFSLTTPLLIGGTAVGSVIQYKGTTGNGTSTVAAHQFLVGNNGATQAVVIYNTGQLNAGNAVANPSTTVGLIRIGQGTSVIDVGQAASGIGGIWFSTGITPSSANYNITGTQTALSFNVPSSSGAINIQTNGSNRITVNHTSLVFAPTSAGTGAVTNFTFTSASNSSQTAGTNIPIFKVTGATTTWASGALATQYFNYFTENTVAFGSSSTLTNGYNFYIESVTAGTNATITRKYSLGTSDNVAFGISNSTATLHLGVAPGGQNFALSNAAGAGSMYLNAPSGGFVVISIGTGNRMQVNNTSTAFTPSAAASGSTSTFTFTNPNNTGRTVSTEVHGLKYTAGTQTWATSGTVTTQRDWYLSGAVYATVGTTTIVNAYGFYVDGPTAGSGVTITNNYALGLNGNLALVNSGAIIRGTTGDLIVDANGGNLQLRSGGVAYATITSGGITMRDGANLTFDTTVGTKIGSNTNQKLSFWNATPIVQPTTAVAASTFVANTSLIANDTATFDGYTIGQVVKALRNSGLLA